MKVHCKGMQTAKLKIEKENTVKNKFFTGKFVLAPKFAG